MTKYFDKLQKIKFYNFCYPSHGNVKNNVILGHVDFFWNSLFNVKKFKEDIHLNKPLSKNLNLNGLIMF